MDGQEGVASSPPMATSTSLPAHRSPPDVAPSAACPLPWRPQPARSPAFHQGDLQCRPMMHATSPTEEAVDANVMAHTEAKELPPSTRVPPDLLVHDLTTTSDGQNHCH
jgi:hypothetical protein